MASAAPAASSTKETTNYARLCRLLVDVGTQALRDTFDAIHAPANLHAVLANNEPLLQSLKRRKIINNKLKLAIVILTLFFMVKTFFSSSFGNISVIKTYLHHTIPVC